MNVRKVAVSLLIVILAFISLDVWWPNEVAFSATIDAERDFTAQIFWSEDARTPFSGSKVFSIPIKRGQQKLRTMLPARRIAQIRFDFGTNPGAVSISGIRLSGGGETLLAAEDFRFSRGIDRHWTEGENIHIVSKGDKDPYVVYAKPLDVVGGFSLSGMLFKLPIAVLWVLALLLVSRFCVMVFGRIVQRVGDCLRNGMANVDESGRIVSFDVLRVVAFLFVVFCHVLARADAYEVPYAYTLKGFNWGGLGVSFFFVLSGAALSIGSFNEGGGLGAFCMRRLRAIMPSFWVAYLACLLVSFVIYDNMMIMGGDLSKIVQTVFGMDGYLGNQHANYYLVGEWYLGCMLLTYLLAPFLNRQISRNPVVTLAVLFVFAVLSILYTPELSETLSFWNRKPGFNVLPHLPEFAFGMVFWRFVRPYFRRYAAVAAGLSVYLVCYLCFSREPTFACSWCGIPAAIAAFVLLCFALDMVPVSNSRSVISFLAKTTFLAFLYHHCLIYWLIKAGSRLDMQLLVYKMLLVVSISYGCAYLSLKPVDAVKRLVFGGKKDSGR